MADETDHDELVDRAHRVIVEAYSRHRADGKSPLAALGVATQLALAAVDDLTKEDIGIAADSWLTESGQRDFDNSQEVAALIDRIWALGHGSTPGPAKKPFGKSKPHPRKLRLKTWGGIPLVVLDDNRLSRTDIRAFGYVASHIATSGGKEYSYGELAQRLCVTRREAIRAVGTLTDSKYLIVKKKGTGRRGNVYAFGPDALADHEPA